jgi:hypothetical protein
MKHLSLARLSLLGGEPIVQDLEESQHLKHCQHCMKLLRWFADERVTEFEELEKPEEAFAEAVAVATNRQC